MKPFLWNALSLAMCVALGGCGGDDAAKDGDGTCSLSPPPVPAVTVTKDSPDFVRQSAEATQFAVMERLFGRYLRGDAPVYRGTLSASDTQSVLIPTNGAASGPDQTLPAGDVFGRLVIDGDQAELRLYSPQPGKYLSFLQKRSAPGVTEVSPITSQLPQIFARCEACAPDLFERPAKLDWVDEVALLDDATVTTAPFSVKSTLSLKAESVCELDWDDEIPLLDYIGGYGTFSWDIQNFRRVDDWMVESVNGAIETVPWVAHTCEGMRVPYTAELFWDPFHIDHFGVRNIVLLPSEPVCAPF